MEFLKLFAVELAMTLIKAVTATFFAVIAVVVGVLFVAAFLLASSAIAAESDQAEGAEGGLLIRFVPIQVKAQELVAVELVRPAHLGERYKILERAVFKSDWRPALFTMSDQYNPGKCTIELIPEGYDIDCTLDRIGGYPFERRQQVKNVEAAIAFIKVFSKARTAPVPETQKKRKDR